MKKKKVILKKISRKPLGKKTHVVPCKTCKNPTECASEAEWVICWECVAKMSYIQVKKAANPRKKKTVATKTKVIVKKSLPKTKKKVSKK